VQVARIGDRRYIYKIMVGRPEGKRPARRPRSLGDFIRLDLREIGREVVEWMHLVQGRVQLQAIVNTMINLWVP